MQSVDRRDHITVLILLAASTMLGVLAQDVGTVAEPTASPAEGAAVRHRLFLAAALAGSLIAVLMLLSPGRSHRSLRRTLREFWPQLAGLALLVIGYALALGPLGFFLATSLFLTIGYVLLGGRHPGALLILALPVAAALELLMHGMFGVASGDPLLRALGVVS